MSRRFGASPYLSAHDGHRVLFTIGRDIRPELPQQDEPPNESPLRGRSPLSTRGATVPRTDFRYARDPSREDRAELPRRRQRPMAASAFSMLDTAMMTVARVAPGIVVA